MTDETKDNLKAQIALFAAQPHTLSIKHAEILATEIDCDGNYVKIAAALNLPIGTVRSRLHRARKRFAAAKAASEKAA